MTKILITGATGFLGKALCLYLMKEGYKIRGTYRTTPPQEAEFQTIEWIKIPDLMPMEIWEKALEEIDIVIHSAARVHQMHASENEEEKFHHDNVLGTQALLEAILRNKNVKQFIFISTILVYGKSQSMPLNRNKECIPDTLYGKSKLNAELLVQNLLNSTTTSWTILRPTVMYGDNNKGNIASLENLIRKGIPIPVKGIRNKRSFLSVQNMCKYVSSYLLNEDTQNKIFCVADPHPISTEQLVNNLGKSLNIKAKVIWVPFFMLSFLALVGNLAYKLGVKLPWNRDVLAKIAENYWVSQDNIHPKN